MSAIFHRRTDQFSFELGKVILEHAQHDFAKVVEVGQHNLPLIRQRVRGYYYQRILDSWEEAMKDIESLSTLMLRTDSYGIDARKVMPFIGIITPQERQKALDRARGDEHPISKKTSKELSMFGLEVWHDTTMWNEGFELAQEPLIEVNVGTEEDVQQLINWLQRHHSLMVTEADRAFRTRRGWADPMLPVLTFEEAKQKINEAISEWGGL